MLGADGWNSLVDDIDVLVERTHNRMEDVPVVLFGHSMGSFAAQQYLLDHSGRIAGLALSGTAAIDLLEPALDLDAPIDLSAFNAPFVHRTGYEWLSRDDAQVDAYVADERCGFGLDAEGGKAMFARAREVADPDRLAGIRKDLPIHIMVGRARPGERSARAGQRARRAAAGRRPHRRDAHGLARRPARDLQRDQPGRGGSGPAGVA